MGYRLHIKLFILLMIWKDVASDTSTVTEDANIERLSLIEEQIDNLKSLVSDQGITIARQLTTIANLRADIAGQNTKIAQQDTTIANLRADIAGQNSKIAQQDTTIANSRADIAGQNSKITQQDTTIANLRADIAGQNTKIAQQVTTIAHLHEQDTRVGLLQDWNSVLDDLNKTQFVQASELTELKTLLRNATHSLDSEDKKLNTEVEKFIGATIQLNTTLQTLKANEREVIYSIAAGKTTEQSSTYAHGSSNLAIDNNWDGNYYHKHCSHTQANNDDPLPWWRVDLATSHLVYVVVIKNRGDGHWNRILDAEVLVADEQHYEVCGTFNGPTFAGEVRHFSCNPPLQGRYVKIQQTRKDFLQLCEVAVYGHPL